MQDGRNPEVSSGRQAEERGEHELEGEVGREEGERAVLEGEQGEVARRERGREKERGGRREREGGVVEGEKRRVEREEGDSESELTLLNQTGDNLLTEEGRPRLIINIMSGECHTHSLGEQVLGHDEVEVGEEHDYFHDIPSSSSTNSSLLSTPTSLPSLPTLQRAEGQVVLRHPRREPLHGEKSFHTYLILWEINDTLELVGRGFNVHDECGRAIMCVNAGKQA